MPIVLGPAVAAARLGVITKGVGYLPLLILVPFALLARRGWPTAGRIGWMAALAGRVSTLAAIAVWLVPMLLASSAGGELAAYRDEILFRRTVTRYAGAWHHNQPFWCYVVSVIPALWLQLIALVPWLWSRWRAALRERDTLVAALLSWVVTVVLFFSSSSGKRGVYVVPAVPALVTAAALAAFRVRDGWLAYGGVLASVLVTTGLAIYPRIDAVRSCRAFMARVEEASAESPRDGTVGFDSRSGLGGGVTSDHEVAKPMGHPGRGMPQSASPAFGTGVHSKPGLGMILLRRFAGGFTPGRCPIRAAELSRF